jgi:8-amino-7-oxononanoate synthase
MAKTTAPTNSSTTFHAVPDDQLSHLLHSALQRRREAALLRQRAVVEQLSSTRVRVNGQELISFCSNDYLGLSCHPKIAAAMAQAAREHGSGAGASPLITGHTPIHDSADRAIARWKATQRAILLPSGYQANHASVQALAGAAESAGQRVRFILDKFVHASLIDAVRASGEGFRVFPHNELDKLTRLLSEADADELQVVITESIFSMDGDAAPLAELAELKRSKKFVLLLDEAHASGVYGPGGAGYAAELGLGDIADVHIVTLSKALGVAGGAICCSDAFADAVVNFGRAYIYSTAISPALAAGAEAAIAVLHDEPQRQQRVRVVAARLRAALADAGMNIPHGDSPIIPILLGDERRAIAAAEFLQSRGILALAIRPPTVAKDSSRLRVTLSSEHTDAEIEQLIVALQSLRP